MPQVKEFEGLAVDSDEELFKRAIRQVKTKWESTEPNPDEEHLKKVFQEEVRSFELDFANERAFSRQRTKSLEPLMKAGGQSAADIKKLVKVHDRRARKSIAEATRDLAKPNLDIEAMHKQDLKMVEELGKQFTGEKAVSMSGVLFNPAYGGAWMCWNGEAEEIPSVTFALGSKRFDPRAQAYGEGLFDADFSRANGYLAFTFRPPTWGHLHIYTYPWMHGYYCLYSDDEWYNKEYAKATVDTWVDLHQGYWRPRQSVNRFRMEGDELHPWRCGRIDRQFAHHYTTHVGERDRVTIRVGAQIFSYGRASGGRALLNFQSGASNYVYVPYVFWYLHR